MVESFESKTASEAQQLNNFNVQSCIYPELSFNKPDETELSTGNYENKSWFDYDE